MAIEKVNGIENAALPEGVQVAVTETEITPGITEFEDGSKVEVKEGDILTFSSHLYHRSPINNSNKRKSVIVFNSSFEGYIS